MRKWTLLGALVVILCGAAAFLFVRGFDWPNSPWAKGTVIETQDGVPVYDNGPIFSISHGRSFAADGTYFGQKWQCVEFVKRYLYSARGHVMPNGMGNAASFFDGDTPQGALNEKRGMLQYRQGGTEPPRRGDLIVFAAVAGYGHVAIVSDIASNTIEIVQQNASPPRQRLPMTVVDGGYRVDHSSPTLGWLRVPSMQANASLAGEAEGAFN
jgi:surface antigen